LFGHLENDVDVFYQLKTKFEVLSKKLSPFCVSREVVRNYHHWQAMQYSPQTPKSGQKSFEILGVGV